MQRSDLQINDTPALAILADRPDAFAGIDGPVLKLAQDYLRVAKAALGSFADAFAAHGLSPGRYAVLMALLAQEEGLAPSEIAERLGVSRATVTGLVTGLEKGGLIKSVASNQDRRSKVIVLSKRGRSVLGKVVPDIFGQMVALFSHFDESDQRRLRGLLAKIEAAIGDGERTKGKKR